MKGKEKLYRWLMYMGGLSGCHQRPDRSFFCCGRQFPVCARCTGVFCGQIIGLATFSRFQPAMPQCVVLVTIMLLDWALQFWKLLPSTNLRRLITGTLCGYGMTGIMLKLLLVLRIYLVS